MDAYDDLAKYPINLFVQDKSNIFKSAFILNILNFRRIFDQIQHREDS